VRGERKYRRREKLRARESVRREKVIVWRESMRRVQLLGDEKELVFKEREIGRREI
jgi:hypothetical protein